MDRFGRERDSPGGGGRPLHTYTPRSHEDLLRSHLQLDASRNAKLQSELQRLADENKKLRHGLDNALKDSINKDDEINALKNKLQERPPTLRSSISEDKVFEIDGKPLTLDQIINHFDGVIQKHHNLLDKKNKQIEDLENALKNRPPPYSRNDDTRSPNREDKKQAEDLAKELALIRKEYEQVEKILTDRNNKLENLIEDLKKKLDQYADEIGRLRQELANKDVNPRNSTLLLLREKEKENEYLKDLINSLQNQPQQNYMFPSNEDMENEIKKIIDDKKKAVKRLSNMIIELKNTPSANEAEPPDKKDLEQDCKEMMGDLNNMNDKLNNLMDKLKQKPQGVHGEPVNKDGLLHSLTSLKKQCEDEIHALKSQLKDAPSSEKPVVLTGIGRVKIEDPEALKKRYPDGRLPDEPVNIPSNVEFYLYPTPSNPLDRQPPKRKSSDSYRSYKPRYDEPQSRAPDPTPDSSLKSYIPVEYSPITPEVSIKQLPVYGKEKPQGRLYPEIPSETKSIPPKTRKHPTSCEACQDDYPFGRPHKHDYHEPDKRLEKPTPKPNKKGCCGGKKGSESSNVPYEKNAIQNSPYKEEIIYIHQPNSAPKPKKKLIYKFKADRHK